MNSPLFDYIGAVIVIVIGALGFVYVQRKDQDLENLSSMVILMCSTVSTVVGFIFCISTWHALGCIWFGGCK